MINLSGGDGNIRKLSTALTGCQSEAIHAMGPGARNGR